jgi:ABC-2 type transport system permease protein
MGKYLTVFKTSWQRELEYRTNFLLGRLHSIVILILPYFVWTSLASASGKFASYSLAELVTYVFGVNILHSIIMGSQSRRTAFEINDGTFSIYLLKPINHFWYVFWSELAQRSMNLIMAVVEVIILAKLLGARIIWQHDINVIFFFLLSIFFAVFLYFILSYLVSLIAFWSREAMGPRFLFEWFLEFASGAFFPLNILSGVFYAFLVFLPFAYLVYFPLSVYIGRLGFWQIITGIFIQLIFIVLFGFLTMFVWRKGLRRYSGEGI